MYINILGGIVKLKKKIIKNPSYFREQRDKLRKFILDHLYLIRVIAIFLMFIYYLLLKQVSRNYEIPLIIVSLFCLSTYLIKVEDIPVENYFESDEVIYNKINENFRINANLIISFFCIVLFIVASIILEILYNFRGIDWVKSPVDLTITLTSIVVISFYLTDLLRNLFTYNFTINYTFIYKKYYRQRLWIYLRYKKEVIEQIKKNQQVFTEHYIKKQNKNMVTYEELEIVKDNIKTLSVKQLEKIIFKDNQNSFSTNELFSWKSIIPYLYWLWPIILFFREELKSFIINTFKPVFELFPISQLNDYIDNIFLFLGIKDNQIQLINFYIFLILIIISLCTFIRNKIIIYLFHPRKSTIDNNLIPLIEEELEKRKKERELLST